MRIAVSIVLTATLVPGMLGLVAAPKTASIETEEWMTSDDPPSIDRSDVLVALGSLGLTPETAAVAGLSVAEVSTILGFLAQNSIQRTELLAALDAASAARQACAQAEQRTRNEPGNTAVIAALMSAQQQASAAEAHQQAARQALAAMVDQTVVREVSRGIRSVADVTLRELPAEFSAAELSPQQMFSVRVALKAERRSERTGEALNTAFQQRLSNIRSNAAVVEARQRMNERLAAIRSAFEAAGVR